MSPVNRGRWRDIIALGALILIAAAFNLGKPVHIDDTAYLQTAQHLAEHPLRPMSFLLNWGDTGRRAFEELNQPPLFFYFLAGVIRIFGPSVLVLHGAMALLSAAAILLCHRVARRIAPDLALLVTALCVLSAAFLPGQNLMTDVPLLALWLAAMDRILAAGEADSPAIHYALAGLAAAAACVTKYSAFGLFATIVAVVAVRRRPSGLIAIAIPVIAVSAWSWWNWIGYGQVHMLSRPSTYDLVAARIRSLDWLTGVGLAVPWAWLWLFRRRQTATALFVFAMATAAGVGAFTLTRAQGTADLQAAWITAVLVSNGVFAAVAMIGGAAAAWRRDSGYAERDRSIVLVAWFAGVAAMSIVYAPFMAMRHILPAVPAIVLLICRDRPEIFSRRAIAMTAFAVAAAVAIPLAAADFAWANVYPRYADVIATRYSPTHVVALGHWGWQWYVDREGWEEYDRRRTTLNVGDVVIEPTGISRQQFTGPQRRQLTLESTVFAPAAGLTTIRTVSLYAFSWKLGTAPLRFSSEPIESFDIFRVVTVAK